MGARRTTAWVAALVGLALVVGPGCGGDDEVTAAKDCTPPPASVPSESPSTTFNANQFSKLVRSRLQVDVDGDVAFHYDEPVDLRVVAINTPAAGIRFFSAGIHEHEKIPGDAQFRVYVDLAGDYVGDCEYKIDAVGGKPKLPAIDKKNPDPNASARGFSKAFLSYIKLKPGETVPSTDTVEFLREFQNALEPCSLTIDDGNRTGDLECPKLADDKGEKTVSMSMRWSEA